METAMESAYDFSFKTLIDGRPMPLDQFRGMVLLIVNTASKCGFTPQYAALEQMYTAHKNKGFVIIGVPSNDFGRQETGTNQDIAHFCQINYGVTFPMAAKEIVSGKNAHPFYGWAKNQMGFLAAPKWNFHKYLVDRQGNLIDYFTSATKPDSDRMKKAIIDVLAGP